MTDMYIQPVASKPISAKKAFEQEIRGLYRDIAKIRSILGDGNQLLIGQYRDLAEGQQSWSLFGIVAQGGIPFVVSALAGRNAYENKLRIDKIWEVVSQSFQVSSKLGDAFQAGTGASQITYQSTTQGLMQLVSSNSATQQGLQAIMSDLKTALQQQRQQAMEEMR